MSSIITNILALVVTLGILIAFHEFGHYWIARKCGVKVLRFSIGFGKPLWIRKLGADQTEYVLAAIPLGGFVKMLDEREGEVEAHEVHRAFNRQSIGKRFAIVAAGPIFNFIFAIFAYFLMFIMGVPGIKPIVGEVVADSAAYHAGFQAKDQITHIAAHQTPTWNSVRITLLAESLDSDILSVDVLSEEGVNRRLELDLGGLTTEMKQENIFENLGIVQYQIPIPAVIGKIEPESPALRDGLKVDDLIVSTNDKPVANWRDWVAVVRQHPESSLKVEIKRSGVIQIINLTPAKFETETGIIGRIGAAPAIPAGYGDELRSEEYYPFGQAIVASFEKTWQMSVLTVRMIFKMVVGEVSVKNLSGPITIATYAGYTASVGLTTFLSFLAVVSVSLGVLNLLPIPILDGGHLLNYTIEFLKGSPLSDALQLKMQQFGILLLGMLMILAFYNDINRLIG